MKTLKMMLVLAAGLLCLNCFAATSKTKTIRLSAKSQSSQSSGCREVDCSNCSFDDESCEECCATTKPPPKKSSSGNKGTSTYDGSKD